MSELACVYALFSYHHSFIHAAVFLQIKFKIIAHFDVNVSTDQPKKHTILKTQPQANNLCQSAITVGVICKSNDKCVNSLRERHASPIE